MIDEELLLEEELKEWSSRDAGPMQMGSISASWMLEQLQKKSRDAGRQLNWRKSVEHWAHLVRIGVIATLGDPHASNISGKPHTFVTAKGREYLASREATPHNADRYLAEVRKKVPVPDPVVVAYLLEGVGAWQARLYRSTMVMLGCAYEKIVLELVHAIAASTLVASSQKLDKAMKAPKPPPVSALFDEVSKAIKEFDDQKLLGPFADAWDRYVVAAFEHVRVLRNSAGHPTGAEITAQEAEGALLMFPTFYARMQGLTTQIANAAP